MPLQCKGRGTAYAHGQKACSRNPSGKRAEGGAKRVRSSSGGGGSGKGDGKVDAGAEVGGEDGEDCTARQSVQYAVRFAALYRQMNVATIASADSSSEESSDDEGNTNKRCGREFDTVRGLLITASAWQTGK